MSQNHTPQTSGVRARHPPGLGRVHLRLAWEALVLNWQLVIVIFHLPRDVDVVRLMTSCKCWVRDPVDQVLRIWCYTWNLSNPQTKQHGYSTPHSTQSWAENCGHELIYCPSSSQTSANQRLQSDTRRIIPQQEPLPELPMLWSKWKCKNRSFELACTQVQRLVMQKILCRNQTCWFLLTCLIVSRHK